MIYAITNAKGGTGKSTTAGAILSGATIRGRRALAIDADQQGNLTFATGADQNRPGTFELLTGKADAADVVQHTPQGDVIAGGPMLATAEITLRGNDRHNALKRAIKGIKNKYDVIVIDCPPATGTILLNALTAADRVIIPTGANIYALQGLAFLIETIRETQAAYNSHLHISGILFTMYNDRTNSAKTYREIIEKQAGKWHVPIFKTRIRRGVAVEEAQGIRESLFKYAPRSNPARDYMDFLNELEI